MHLSRFIPTVCFALLTTLIAPPQPAAAGEEPTPRPTFANEHSDLNQDNVVDAEDLLIFMQDWGKATGPGSVITVDIPGLPEGARPMRLVRIPAGTFQMGSPDTERSRDSDEGPVHTVTLTQDFYMGETEVTQAQWQALMGSYPTINLDGNDYPIHTVSWDDITQENGFLGRLNALGQGTFRLPSEAEWEYACRAGTTMRFSFGDVLDCDDGCGSCALASQYMWWCGNNPRYRRMLVAGKLPNEFGLFDMHGNVWEWCQDAYQSNFYWLPAATHLNPLCINPAATYRVVRGGTWGRIARGCRSADRTRISPTNGRHEIGFRVVLPASP